MSNGWVAKIGDDYVRFGTSIVWMRDFDGRREVSNGTERAVINQDDIVPPIDALHLSDDHLRALFAALLHYYNGADDARMLRKDYDAERARVDRLIGALLPVPA